MTQRSGITIGYLTLVGLMYVALGIFCAVAPAKASATVGFTLNGGAGSSEFLTVYGGLEIGMGLAFLMPLWRRESTAYALHTCLLIHLALVVCRTIGFAIFSDIGAGTIKLAIGEWVILLLGIACWFRRSKPKSAD